MSTSVLHGRASSGWWRYTDLSKYWLDCSVTHGLGRYHEPVRRGDYQTSRARPDLTAGRLAQFPQGYTRASGSGCSVRAGAMRELRSRRTDARTGVGDNRLRIRGAPLE